MSSNGQARVMFDSQLARDFSIEDDDFEVADAVCEPIASYVAPHIANPPELEKLDSIAQLVKLARRDVGDLRRIARKYALGVQLNPAAATIAGDALSMIKNNLRHLGS